MNVLLKSISGGPLKFSYDNLKILFEIRGDGATTFSITTLGIMTLSIMALNTIILMSMLTVIYDRHMFIVQATD